MLLAPYSSGWASCGVQGDLGSPSGKLYDTRVAKLWCLKGWTWFSSLETPCFHSCFLVNSERYISSRCPIGTLHDTAIYCSSCRSFKNASGFEKNRYVAGDWMSEGVRTCKKFGKHCLRLPNNHEKYMFGLFVCLVMFGEQNRSNTWKKA